MVRCKGLTTKGRQCRKQVEEGSEYCVFHKDQADEERKASNAKAEERSSSGRARDSGKEEAEKVEALAAEESATEDREVEEVEEEEKVVAKEDKEKEVKADKDDDKKEDEEEEKELVGAGAGTQGDNTVVVGVVLMAIVLIILGIYFSPTNNNNPTKRDKDKKSSTDGKKETTKKEKNGKKSFTLGNFSYHVTAGEGVYTDESAQKNKFYQSVYLKVKNGSKEKLQFPSHDFSLTDNHGNPCDQVSQKVPGVAVEGRLLGKEKFDIDPGKEVTVTFIGLVDEKEVTELQFTVKKGYGSQEKTVSFPANIPEKPKASPVDQLAKRLQGELEDKNLPGLTRLKKADYDEGKEHITLTWQLEGAKEGNDLKGKVEKGVFKVLEVVDNHGPSNYKTVTMLGYFSADKVEEKAMEATFPKEKVKKITFTDETSAAKVFTFAEGVKLHKSLGGDLKSNPPAKVGNTNQQPAKPKQEVLKFSREDVARGLFEKFTEGKEEGANRYLAYTSDFKVALKILEKDKHLHQAMLQVKIGDDKKLDKDTAKSLETFVRNLFPFRPDEAWKWVSGAVDKVSKKAQTKGLGKKKVAVVLTKDNKVQVTVDIPKVSAKN